MRWPIESKLINLIQNKCFPKYKKPNLKNCLKAKPKENKMFNWACKSKFKAQSLRKMYLISLMI